MTITVEKVTRVDSAISAYHSYTKTEVYKVRVDEDLLKAIVAAVAAAKGAA